jgi:hypothetical protein
VSGKSTVRKPEEEGRHHNDDKNGETEQKPDSLLVR